MRKGMLMVLSGPSGVGKDTVRAAFQSRCPNLYSSVSATTRGMRPGEKDGVNYHYLTRDAFESMIKEGNLLEYTQYNGNYYGTPRKFLEAELAAGHDLLLVIEVEGALNVRRAFPDAVLCFMVPPTMADLRARLSGRGTEDEAHCEARIRRAYEEIEYARNYDYIVVNDTLEEASHRLMSIYEAEGLRRERTYYLVEKLTSEVGE